MSVLLKKAKEKTIDLENRYGAIDSLHYKSILDFIEQFTKEFL